MQPDSRELPPRLLTLADRTVLASRRRSGLTLGIVLSLAAHLLLLGGTLLWARLGPTRVVAEKPIVARLVRLGEPRDERLLPRLPQEPKTPPPSRPSEPPPPPPEVATPPPPAPKPPTPPPAPPEPTVAKATAPVDPPQAEKKAPEPTPAPTPTPTPTPEAKAKAPEPKVDADEERRRRMAQALESLAVPPEQGPFGTSESTPEGRPDGDPRGTAEDAEEGDRYVALVVQALKSNYVVPAVIPQRERLFLSCKLRLVISPNGRIASWRIEESSGNEHFDRAVETSIQRTTFPPPPQSFLSRYGRDGIGFEFKP